METLENKSYDLSAHCPRQAAVWYSHTGEKDRPSHVHFYTCCLTAWARADMAEEWLWYSIRNGLYGTVSGWRLCLYLVKLNNNHEMAKIWDLTRKCPGFSWKHHVLLRLSQQASLRIAPGDVVHLWLNMDRRSHAMLRTLLSYCNVSRGFGSATKAPFTAAACLLSSISLEFDCSGWKLPESSKAEMMSMTHPPLPFYKHLESQTKDRQSALLRVQRLNFPENDYFYTPYISGIL